MVKEGARGKDGKTDAPARRARAGATQMNFTLERVTQPDIEPVTLDEMKRHLRCFMSVTDEDDDITALIVAAREWIEDYTAPRADRPNLAPDAREPPGRLLHRG